MIITKNYEELTKEAAKIIVDTMKQYPEGLYCFAGGDTPVGIYKLLVEAHNKGHIDLRKASYIQLDEWVGINPDNPGSCAAYLMNNLFLKVGVPLENIHMYDVCHSDLDKECEKALSFINKHRNITLSLLGVGVNGHLGFNEPMVSPNKDVHIVKLQSDTKNVGKKYFEHTTLVPSYGITLGLKTLIQSDKVIVVASGKTKQKAIAAYQNKIVDQNWPITHLHNAKRSVVIVDQEAIAL